MSTTEKVRGMNAALRSGNGALREAERKPVHLTRRQVALALVVAVVGAGVAAYTIQEVRSSARTFPAIITSAQSADLNFPLTGKVTDILVRPGDHVEAGQVLARQDTEVLQSNVAADTAIIQADQAAIDQAQAPSQLDAQQKVDAVQLAQAQAVVGKATADLASARSVGDATVAAAKSVVAGDQAVVNQDQAAYSQACPNGPVPPGPQATQSQTDAFIHCQDLQSRLARDNAALNQAQAQVEVAVTQQAQNVNSATAALASAQLAVTLVQSQTALQSSPDVPATLAQDRANLAQAQANLAQGQAALRQATIVAPFAGTVAEVGGTVGEYLGSDGVRQYAGPTALPSTQLPGFQLFPATPASPNSRSTDVAKPVIRLEGGEPQLIAQVSESAISKFKRGTLTRVSINASSWSGSALVAEVVLAPAQSTGSIAYDVVLDLADAPPGLLPGMSADVATE